MNLAINVGTWMVNAWIFWYVICSIMADKYRRQSIKALEEATKILDEATAARVFADEDRSRLDHTFDVVSAYKHTSVRCDRDTEVWERRRNLIRLIRKK
jgi:hypothetical protein